MSTQHARLVEGITRVIIPNLRNLPQGYTDGSNLYDHDSQLKGTPREFLGSSYLLRKRLHMLRNYIVAARMVENREAPWVFEGHQMRLSREEVERQNLEPYR